MRTDGSVCVCQVESAETVIYNGIDSFRKNSEMNTFISLLFHITVYFDEAWIHLVLGVMVNTIRAADEENSLSEGPY